MSPIRRPFQDAKAAACPSKSLERDWPKRFPHPRSRSGPHHNDHDDSAGMRPKLDERTESEVRHQDYLDTLPVPNLETVEDIAKTQEEKEKEIDGKYGGSAGRADGMAEDKERKKAASTIQVSKTTKFMYYYTVSLLLCSVTTEATRPGGSFQAWGWTHPRDGQKP